MTPPPATHADSWTRLSAVDHRTRYSRPLGKVSVLTVIAALGVSPV